jgi:hypothetical protein
VASENCSFRSRGVWVTPEMLAKGLTNENKVKT